MTQQDWRWQIKYVKHQRIWESGYTMWHPGWDCILNDWLNCWSISFLWYQSEWTLFHPMYKNLTCEVLCTSSKCRWSIYCISSKCHWSIYHISWKHRGTLWILHKVERSSPTVNMQLYNRNTLWLLNTVRQTSGGMSAWRYRVTTKDSFYPVHTCKMLNQK